MLFNIVAMCFVINEAYGQSFKEYSAIPWAKAKHMDDSQFFRSPWVVLVEKKPRNRTPMTVLPQNNDNIDVSPRSRSEICLHGICEGTHDKNTLNKIENLYRSSPLKDYFGDVIKPRLEITSRTGLNFENMCSMRSRTAYPKTMLNNKNMKKIIANHPTNSKLQQSIQYNYCNNDTEAYHKCGEAYLKGNVQTRCIQQYSIVRMVVVENGTHFELDHFQIPTSCVCSYLDGF